MPSTTPTFLAFEASVDAPCYFFTKVRASLDFQKKVAVFFVLLPCSIFIDGSQRFDLGGRFAFNEPSITTILHQFFTITWASLTACNIFSEAEIQPRTVGSMLCAHKKIIDLFQQS